MHTQSSKMRSCIDECMRCYSTCLSTTMNHCLEAGGKHIEPDHFRLMSACAEICKTSAAMMLIGSKHHKNICAVCADICEDCAKDCERIGDMDECIQACRKCAASCRSMAA